MKEENSIDNQLINDYNLYEINKDNEIEFGQSDVEISNELIKQSDNISKQKITFNYSLILKNIISDVNNNNRKRYYNDEYRTNLLLMSSLKNIHFKLICLNIILRFNDDIKYTHLVYYILSKARAYYEKESRKLNKKTIIDIFAYSSRILYQNKNLYYSFYYIWKAKNMFSVLENKKQYRDEEGEIDVFYKEALDTLRERISTKCNNFKENRAEKMTQINQILDNILRENQKENNNNKEESEIKEESDNIDINSDDGSYVFLINKDWVLKAKIFIDYYLILTKESLIDENSIKATFKINKILNSYFDLESTTSATYPGPINNFNLLKYKDCWIDPDFIEENNYITQNSKEYISISEKDYNIIKDEFDSTNDIKILANNLEYFELKILILDARFKDDVTKKFLRLRTIKARTNMIIKNFEFKIARCIYHEIKKPSKLDEKSNKENKQNEDNEVTKKFIQRVNFSFYLINKERKNVLSEICLAFTNNFENYNSCFINQLSYSEEKDTLKTLLNNYDKSKHYLIIEISDKYSDTFLKEIRPNENMEYSCKRCEKKIKEKEKYFCSKCYMSVYCGKDCAEKCQDHQKMHNILSPLLKKEINIDSLKDKILSLNAFYNEGRVGLYNLGNTCYINSVIQCLSNTQDLNKYLVFDFYQNEMNFRYLNFGCNIVESLSNIFKKLWQDNERVISSGKFNEVFFGLNKQFTPGTEQDAHEFLSSLLSNLHDNLNRVYPNKNNGNKKDKEKEKEKENEKDNDNKMNEEMENEKEENNDNNINNDKEKENEKEKLNDNKIDNDKEIENEKDKVNEKEKEDLTIEEKYNNYLKEEKKNNDSFIHELFTGHYISKTICQECQKEVINFEPFNTLNLPIPKKHFSFSIKYFTDNGAKAFPIAINENTTINDIKEKALYYYEKDIINKIKKNYGNETYNLLNKEANNCIYNYNVSKLPKKILYNYIDVIILDKNKSIYSYNLSDNVKILQYLKIKDYDYYEIVLYEKNIISDNYINLYFQASNYNKDKKLIFFKSDIINYSYPILLSVSKDVSLQTLEKILYKKVEILLKQNNDIHLANKAKKKNLIDIIIPHSKTISSCPFCHKKYEEKEFCYYSELLEKNSTILSLLINNKELNTDLIPIIFIANSKYFEVKPNYNYNSNILFIEPDKSSKNDKELNLFDCLGKFREEDILDNDNKWFCERCNQKQKAKRKMEIYNTSPYLIIQLKRFNYSNNIFAKFFERTKNDTLVNYPETIDLKEYIVGEGNNNSLYGLYAYILHLDNHYLALIKNCGSWILYNDDSLFSFSFKQSKNTYLLFYKKFE